MRVGQVNGEFVVNPTYAERRESAINITVVGTKDGIVMVESGAKEVHEDAVIDAIEFGHDGNQEDCRGHQELVSRRQAEAHRRAS